MSTLAAAKEAIAKHLKQMEAFQYASTVLSLVESIENERAEAHARLERIQKEVREHDVILSDLKGAESVILADREQDRAEHARRAGEIIAKAEETAKAVEKAAKETIADLEAKANERVTNMVAKAEAAARDANERAIKANLSASAAESGNAKALAELADLTAKIESAKATIAKMLG
jgi:hypothetical protein